MAKFVRHRPDWLKNQKVDAIYSVSSCISRDFSEWINSWRHNGYWFFDSPSVIQEVAADMKVDLNDVAWFYYEGFELEFDHLSGWRNYGREPALGLKIDIPVESILRGFDVVTFSEAGCAEHSPLSCNHMAEELDVNSFCLMDSFDEAKRLIESGAFKDCEPGAYRIIAVSSVSVESMDLFGK